MHHIKLKVPSFAPFVTGIIDNIKMTVHKYHNVWVSHRMNYEPRKLMDVKHSCGGIYDPELNAVVAFEDGYDRPYKLHTVFSPVMSLRDLLRPCARIIDGDNPSRVLDFWFKCLYVNFKEFFGNKWCHTIRPDSQYPDMSYLDDHDKRIGYQYFSSNRFISIQVTDDITVTFKPCR